LNIQCRAPCHVAKYILPAASHVTGALNGPKRRLNLGHGYARGASTAPTSRRQPPWPGCGHGGQGLGPRGGRGEAGESRHRKSGCIEACINTMEHHTNNRDLKEAARELPCATRSGAVDAVATCCTCACAMLAIRNHGQKRVFFSLLVHMLGVSSGFSNFMQLV
jgi:hypothetical protein